MAEQPASITPAWLRVATPSKAWQGMLDLHRRALGGTAGLPPSATALTPEQAFAALSNAVASALAQIAVLGTAGADRLLSGLCDHVEANRKLDGVESPFLSALVVALRSGGTPVTDRAAKLWRTHGRPPKLTGGAAGTVVLAADDRVTLATPAMLDGALGGLPTDPAGLAAALARLFPQSALPADAGAPPPVRPVAGLTDASQGVLAFAGAVAGHAELRRRLKSPEPQDMGNPQVLDRIVDALKRTIGGMLPSPTGPAGPGPAVAQGAAVVVDVAVLGGPPAPPPELVLVDDSQPPGIRPAPTVLHLRPDDSFDFTGLPYWPELSTTPSFVVGGPGIERFAVVLGERSAWLAAMPELSIDGTLAAPGFLAAANLSLPVAPPSSPGFRAVATGGRSSGLSVASGGRSLRTPMYLSFVVYPPHWPVTGGDPDAGGVTLAATGSGRTALEMSALTFLEEVARVRKVSPEVDVFTAIEELTR
jgi:hypothetical protein